MCEAIKKSYAVVDYEYSIFMQHKTDYFRHALGISSVDKILLKRGIKSSFKPIFEKFELISSGLADFTLKKI